MTGSGVDVAEAFNNALLSDSTSALQKLARGLWARVREHGVVDSQDARQAVSMKVSSRLARALHAPDVSARIQAPDPLPHAAWEASLHTWGFRFRNCTSA